MADVRSLDQVASCHIVGFSILHLYWRSTSFCLFSTTSLFQVSFTNCQPHCSLCVVFILELSKVYHIDKGYLPLFLLLTFILSMGFVSSYSDWVGEFLQSWGELYLRFRDEIA